MSVLQIVKTEWEAWKRAEPLVDLSYISDTEVAEYRRWAGTAGWHNRTVEELISFAEGRTIPKCDHCGNKVTEHNPWCIILQGGRPDD